MSKKLHMITVRGKQHEWSFNVMLDPRNTVDAREDGVDLVAVENVVPVWVAEIGLAKALCFLQDLFNFRNPFNK